MQFGEWTFGRNKIAREFRPQKCAPGGSAKRANENPRAGIGFSRQQFRKVGVGRRLRDNHIKSSFLNRKQARFLRRIDHVRNAGRHGRCFNYSREPGSHSLNIKLRYLPLAFAARS
jgi:hypothetical protein